MADEVRKCRLRPEFAHLNEELTPAVWVPAREWAERLVVRARKARLLSIHQRMLDPSHFEFRGGGRPTRPLGWSRRGDSFPWASPFNPAAPLASRRRTASTRVSLTASSGLRFQDRSVLGK
jgi:hypothetical protein